MKHVLIPILLLLTSCATVEKYNSLTPAERTVFLKDEAVDFLKSHKGAIKTAIVLAGLEAMDRATSPEDRKEISNQMYAASVAFNSLATGKIVSTIEINDVLRSFSKGTTSQGYTKWVVQVGQIWPTVFNNLKLSDNNQLAVEYLILLSEAAQEVATAYKTE